MKEAALAARAKAKKEADEKFFKDAQATATAADGRRRGAKAVAQAASLSDAPLQRARRRDQAGAGAGGAENVKFDGADGKLEFSSASSVKALAAFYRGSLKSLGWQEQPSVINKPNMVVMKFSKGGKALSFTAMQMGPKVNVSADGSGLVMAAAKSGRARPAEASSGSATKVAAQDLEAEPDSALPVPKQRSMRIDGHAESARQRRPVPPGPRRQRPRRSGCGARLLSQRTRQARMEGNGGGRGGKAGPGQTGVFLVRTGRRC